MQTLPTPAFNPERVPCACATPTRIAAFRGRPIAALCAALTMVAFGCSSAPKAAVEDTRLIGSWRTAGGDATLALAATGLYTITVTELSRPILGPYEWDQSTGLLTLQTRRESSACGDDTGVYKVLLSGTTMDAQVERDTCSVRQKLLAQPLKRVSAPR